LIIRTSIIDCYPPREEIYRRLNRFAAFCKQLGIPNVYTDMELYQADKRWKRLHKNAVPEMIEFREKNTHINECRNIKKVFRSRKLQMDEGDFMF
jgi:hypothetical protein